MLLENQHNGGVNLNDTLLNLGIKQKGILLNTTKVSNDKSRTMHSQPFK